ncbi:MAG TPA: 1-deoxy-D-xylulose-5-phosphate synthase [Halanaerobiales bacterium]|nr:1-deoxy-D-xylulose-5-phosphate synthase [Halanaerobiales bacterium]
MSKLLDQVSSPEDLKDFSYDQLNTLSEEIRNFLLETISETGGHLASNLGVVELTVALHYHLKSPIDKIVWDVGHQSYTHKILTGRKDQMHTIRQKGGLSGYLKTSESEHDIIEAGHTSTSISSALGLALARNKFNSTERIYSVIGDGALTAGMALEALNNAGHLGEDMNVILNDNNMSISPNVGALSNYLTKVRTDPVLSKLKDDIEFIIEKIPKIGGGVSKSVDRVKKGLKYVFITGILFEELGFTYLGPIDGHNVEELLRNFKKADDIKGPVLIHINTTKGKGYNLAEEKPSEYHGVSPFDITNGEAKSCKTYKTYSQVFGHTAVKIREKLGNKVVGITAAMASGTGLDIFKEEYPDEFYDVGIAEQHAVTLSAGMARGGLRPLVSIYSTFMQRAYDQIIEDVALQNLPVSLFLDRAGLVGDDGETHHGAFDLSYMRMIPNMVVMAPRDENMLQHMIWTSVKHEGPTSVRYPRGEGYGVCLDDDLKQLEIGTAESMTDPGDILILAVGSMVYPSLEAVKDLKTMGINAEVIDMRFIKPLDKKMLRKKLINYNKVITVEENTLNGGFGSAVLEFIENENIKPLSVKRMGLPDKFVTHGTQSELRAMHNLNVEGIAKTTADFFKGNLEGEVWHPKNA